MANIGEEAAEIDPSTESPKWNFTKFYLKILPTFLLGITMLLLPLGALSLACLAGCIAFFVVASKDPTFVQFRAWQKGERKP